MFNRILYNTCTHHTLPIGHGLVHCIYRPSMVDRHTISSARVYPNPCFDTMEMIARFLVKSLKAKHNKPNTVKAIYRKIRTGGVSVRGEDGAYQIVKHYKEIEIDPKFFYRRGVCEIEEFPNLYWDETRVMVEWMKLNHPNMELWHGSKLFINETAELDRVLISDTLRLYNLTIEDHYAGIR